jgi:hypothetical protein
MDSYSVYFVATRKQRGYNDSTPLRKILLTHRLRTAAKACIDHEDAEEELKRKREDVAPISRPKRPNYTREMDFLPVVEEE